MGTLPRRLPAWHLEADLLPLGVCLLDPSGHIKDANQVELHLLGYSRDEYVGQRFDTFDVNPADGRRLLEVLLRGEAVSGERVERRTRQGGAVRVVLDAHPVFQDAVLRGVHCFTRDESAERQRAQRDAAAAADAVRRRLEHDLHDGVSQLIVGASLLAHRLEERAPGELAGDLARLKEILTEASSRVESIARGRSPLGVGTVSASEALRRIAAEARTTMPMDIVVAVDPALEQQPEHTLEQVCLIAQEAVRNAWRHGHASRVQIRLQGAAGRLTLSIHDDGAGMPVGSPVQGVGLESMRFRAQTLGGSLVVIGEGGAGTLVRCVWSADREAPDRAVTA